MKRRPAPLKSMLGQPTKESSANSTGPKSGLTRLSPLLPSDSLTNRTWADALIPLATAERLERLAIDTGRKPGDLIAEAIRMHYGNQRD